jgi:hypothetical protein
MAQAAARQSASTPLLGLLGAELVARHGQGHGPRQAQTFDQKPTAARIWDKANFAEGLDETGRRGGNGDVAGHGQRSACTRRHAIDGGHHRHAQLLQAPHRGVEVLIDQGTGVGTLDHVGPGVEVKFGQIGTGTKAAPRTRDDQGADLGVALGAVQRSPQLMVHGAGETVQGLGPIQGDAGHGGALLKQDLGF